MKRPLSMTAFGRSRAGSEQQKWIVEIRSVNHRFCDIKIKTSRKYAALEERIKKELMARISRGHIDVTLKIHLTTPLLNI